MPSTGRIDRVIGPSLSAVTGVEDPVHQQPEVDEVIDVERLQRSTCNGDGSSDASVPWVGRQDQNERAVIAGVHARGVHPPKWADSPVTQGSGAVEIPSRPSPVSTPRPAMSRRLLLATAVLLGASCSDDDDGATSEESVATTADATANDSASTTPHQRRRAPSSASRWRSWPTSTPRRRHSASADWATVQEEVVSQGNGAMGLYDDVIAVAPEEAVGQLETLRDYSQEVIDTAAEATSPRRLLRRSSAPRHRRS